jgi:hypothetical protein
MDFVLFLTPDQTLNPQSEISTQYDKVNWTEQYMPFLPACAMSILKFNFAYKNELKGTEWNLSLHSQNPDGILICNEKWNGLNLDSYEQKSPYDLNWIWILKCQATPPWTESNLFFFRISFQNHIIQRLV